MWLELWMQPFGQAALSTCWNVCLSCSMSSVLDHATWDMCRSHWSIRPRRSSLCWRTLAGWKMLWWEQILFPNATCNDSRCSLRRTLPAKDQTSGEWPKIASHPLLPKHANGRIQRPTKADTLARWTSSVSLRRWGTMRRTSCALQRQRGSSSSLATFSFYHFCVAYRALSCCFLRTESYWKPLSLSPVPQNKCLWDWKQFPESFQMVLSRNEAVECFPILLFHWFTWLKKSWGLFHAFSRWLFYDLNITLSRWLPRFPHHSFSPSFASFSNAQVHWSRKGVDCHKTIVQSYLQGMPFDPATDVVVFFDIYPNQSFWCSDAIFV